MSMTKKLAEADFSRRSQDSQPSWRRQNTRTYIKVTGPSFKSNDRSDGHYGCIDTNLPRKNPRSSGKERGNGIRADKQARSDVRL